MDACCCCCCDCWWRQPPAAEHVGIPDLWLPLASPPSPLQFGTPEQDALRRDFTINALFYNLNTGAIEDYCQQVWREG